MAQFKNTNIDDTGFLQLPAGTTAQRPVSAGTGDLRFNTTFNHVEWYDGVYSAWFPTGFLSPVATGGTVTNITQDGKSYRVHTFTSSGTLTVTRSGEIEYLIVAGGGGGSDVGGGGGGGVLQGRLIVSPQAYTITVGAGTGNLGDNSAPGNNGSSSLAFNLIARGGGGAGGGFNQDRGNAGGSGGAGGRNPDGSLWYIGAPGIPGQGFSGGRPDPVISGDWEGGGGGGAGGPGYDAIGPDWGGSGGHGVSSRISGSLQFYGGGGGSGSNSIRGQGGLGGGGLGKLNSDGTNFNGTPNTGGGGGGGWSGVSGAGGSGIVIVRYRTS